MRIRVGVVLTVLVLLLSLFAQGRPALADYGYHTVRPGDTLYAIGRLYGVDPYAIARLNGLANPNRIYVGQVLRISGVVSPQPPVPVPTVISPPSPVPPTECDCSYNRYNCVDFGCQERAQACYEYCWQSKGYDVHGLDGDSNRVACQLWPSCTGSHPPSPTGPLVTHCCKHCVTGKPCGDTCIARWKTCHKPPGCACY